MYMQRGMSNGSSTAHLGGSTSTSEHSRRGSQQRFLHSMSSLPSNQDDGGRRTGSASNSWLAKQDRQLRNHFVEEMRILSKLRHPCITTVMGAVVEANSDCLMVMELMSRGSLHDILYNETYEMEGATILQILKDVTTGLHFLHYSGSVVVHGDIKSHNILVDDHFHAKIADFGLSIKKGLGAGLGAELPNLLTLKDRKSTANACGTPLWMAPELLRGEANTTRSDVYAFGVVIYEIYSRRYPFDGEDTSVVLKQVADPAVVLARFICRP